MQSAQRVSTGIGGLDEILNGGFIAGKAYMIRGGPGTGKTNFGSRFLCSGAAKGEKSLFITLAETEKQIRANGASLGFMYDGVDFLDLSPSSEFFSEVQAYDIFSSAEVEREPITQQITQHISESRPVRVFVDSMTQMRYLAPDPHQYRKQVMSFVRFLSEQGATVLFTSEGSAEAPDSDLQFLSDGIIELGFMASGRSLRVTKLRGSDFAAGTHALALDHHGVHVFPRLVPEGFKMEFSSQTISSGVKELDEMMAGGLERGTITILTGPCGVGKTTLGLQFMKEAASRGERSVVYSFDEMQATMLHRAESMNIKLRDMMDRNLLSIVQVEPLRRTPHEVAHMIRREVEDKKARVLMLDSMSGYKLAFQGEENLVQHIHALTRYLRNMGVTAIFTNEVEALTGDFRATEIGISYLADNIVFMRYVEFQSELRKVIGMLKKRATDFQKSIRQIEMTSNGFVVGEPLTNMEGLLTGIPRFRTS